MDGACSFNHAQRIRISQPYYVLRELVLSVFLSYAPIVLVPFNSWLSIRQVYRLWQTVGPYVLHHFNSVFFRVASTSAYGNRRTFDGLHNTQMPILYVASQSGLPSCDRSFETAARICTLHDTVSLCLCQMLPHISYSLCLPIPPRSFNLRESRTTGVIRIPTASYSRSAVWSHCTLIT